MSATQIAIEDAGTAGTGGHFDTKEEDGKTFVPRNIAKLEEIRCYLSTFGWEVVTNWCTTDNKVMSPWVDHQHDRGRQCHPRVFVRYTNYPTIDGESPSLDTLLALLRQSKAHKLDDPRKLATSGSLRPVSGPAPRTRRRRDNQSWGGW